MLIAVWFASAWAGCCMLWSDSLERFGCLSDVSPAACEAAMSEFDRRYFVAATGPGERCACEDGTMQEPGDLLAHYAPDVEDEDENGVTDEVARWHPVVMVVEAKVEDGACFEEHRLDQGWTDASHT